MFIETVSQHKISRKRSEIFVVICGNGEKTNFEQINDKKTILKPLRGRYALIYFFSAATLTEKNAPKTVHKVANKE